MNENRIVGKIYRERKNVSSRKQYDEYEFYEEILYDMAIRSEEVIKLIKKLEILNMLEDTYPYLTSFSINSFLDEITDEIKEKYIEISKLEPNEFKFVLEKRINVKKDMQFNENWIEELCENPNFDEDEFVNPQEDNEEDINRYKYHGNDINFENHISLNEGTIRVLRNELRNRLKEDFLILTNDELIDSNGNEFYCFELPFGRSETIEDLLSKEFRKLGTSYKKENFLDYFFVYDYFQIRLKQYQERKENIDNIISEKKEEKSIIKKSHEYSDEEKKVMNQVLNDEIHEERKGFILKPNLNKTAEGYVFKQKEFIKSGIKPDTASKYYEKISTLIKNLEYKKIIEHLTKQLS